MVGAFAIAALAPVGLTLAGLITRADSGTLPSLQYGVVAHLPAGTWRFVLLPFLMRPAWLSPLIVAVVSAGLAVTIARSTVIEAGRGKR